MNSVPGDAPELTQAELRRISRKKKILEGATIRLEKLNGRPGCIEANQMDSKLSDSAKYSDPEVEPDIPVHMSAFKEEFATGGSAEATSTNTAVRNGLIRNRFHIFAASILSYVLSLYYTSYSVFLVSGIFIITEVIYFKGPQQNNIIGNLSVDMVMIFAGPRLSNIVKKMNFFLNISQFFLVDVAVNVFCLCSLTYLLKTISSNHYNIADVK